MSTNEHVDLINRLPMFMQDYTELQELYKSQDPEFNALWASEALMRRNIFAVTAEEKGLQRYEQILNIIPPPSATWEERRFSILVRLTHSLPYTWRFLKAHLATLLGKYNFEIFFFREKYLIRVTLELRTKFMRDELARWLRLIIPAHLILEVQIRYNQHSMFRNRTHRQLAKFTHYQLRNEVFNNNGG